MELEVVVQTEVIKLDQFLKLADAVSGGGEAKLRVQEGDVTVNGVVEVRRGRKLHLGDRVGIDGREFRVAH